MIIICIWWLIYVSQYRHTAWVAISEKFQSLNLEMRADLTKRNWVIFCKKSNQIKAGLPVNLHLLHALYLHYLGKPDEYHQLACQFTYIPPITIAQHPISQDITTKYHNCTTCQCLVQISPLSITVWFWTPPQQ